MTENVPATINWEAELKGAAMLVKSKLVPRDITTPEAALFVIMAGRDMGLSPVQSLRGIKPIQGKIECSADLQLGLYHRSGGKSQWVKITDTEAELKLLAPWSIEPHISRFTIEDAKRADLLSNPTWRKYPKAMLRSRAITQGLKDIGFLLGAGVYAPGELGGNVIVDNESGEVLPSTEAVDEPAPRIKDQSGLAGTVESLPDAERDELANVAQTISESVAKQDMEDALNQWNRLDTDQKVATWAMLDKPVQKQIKAAQAAARVQQSDSAPSPLQVRTLISEAKYDEARDLVRSMPEAVRKKYLDEIGKAEAS
jgi:hypothetical protein